MFFTIINYSVNNKKKYIESQFLFFVKKKIIKLLKFKKIYFSYLLNIKQFLFILINNIYWNKVNFLNLQILFIKKNKCINNCLDGLIKLYLISIGNTKKAINLNQIFIKLKNIIWTNIGYFEINDFLKIKKIDKRLIIIESIDKIPYLTKYYIPLNVRISNSNRIRLGAYLSSGVTIMSEGYVNFNTYIGLNCMIEGRVSAGVEILDDCDLGGSSSIMGTLSGGGKHIITIGKNCLLGANSGIGISLGENCTVESGLYITYNSKINLVNYNIIIKAKYLNFLNNLIFYRNSCNGKIECIKINFFLKKINNSLHIN